MRFYIRIRKLQVWKQAHIWTLFWILEFATAGQRHLDHRKHWAVRWGSWEHCGLNKCVRSEAWGSILGYAAGGLKSSAYMGIYLISLNLLLLGSSLWVIRGSELCYGVHGNIVDLTSQWELNHEVLYHNQGHVQNKRKRYVSLGRSEVPLGQSFAISHGLVEGSIGEEEKSLLRLLDGYLC